MRQGLASAALAALVGTAVSQTCVNNTVSSSPPSSGVALQSWSYCAGALDVAVYVQNVDYDKIVTLYYTDGTNTATPRSVIQLGYNESIANNFEIWGAYTPGVNYDGITKLLNLTYQATDVGKTYTQQLNIAVTASGPPASTSTVPAPYASPTGFSQDITTWLAPSNGSQAAYAKQGLFTNIDVAGAANGTVIAAQSYSNPDYAYNWVRDSSLTMDVVQSLYAAAPAADRAKYESILFAYAIARATEQTDPNLQTGLGEPKFNLDNTVFTGPWGRPQNDGPATAAISLMEFSYAFMAAGGSQSTVESQIYNSNTNAKAPVMKDLLFVASNWSSPSFDLWEEEEGDHFYTRMVQHRALVMGTAFATKLGDSATASTLSSAASALNATLAQFWDPVRELIVYEYGPVLHGKSSFKDVSTMLAMIHGYAGDGVYSYTNDKVLATTVQIATTFLPIYGISSQHTDGSGLTLAPPIGRYPEDTYNGTSTDSQGNPWFLATSSLAEVLYRSSIAFTTAKTITITSTNKPFWDYFAHGVSTTVGSSYSSGSTQFTGLISALQGWGDAFLRTVKYHAPPGGSLSEEFNRNTGYAVGAADLTWSYAALLTAAFARAEAIGNAAYVADLAQL